MELNHHHLNRSLSPYGGNNFHHLHPFPAKSPAQAPSSQIISPSSSQTSSRHHPQAHYSHSQLQSLEQNVGSERMRYFGDDLLNETEYSSENSLPLNRHHRNATANHHPLIPTTFFTTTSTPPSPLVFLSPPSSPSPFSNNNNLYSAPITSSSGAAAALAALAPVTTTLPTLLWSNNRGQPDNQSGHPGVDWSRVRQSLNSTVGQLLTDVAAGGGSGRSLSSSYSTASPQLTTSLDRSGESLDVYDGTESGLDAGLWPTAQDIPILIGAVAGECLFCLILICCDSYTIFFLEHYFLVCTSVGALLLIVFILLLVIWNCCDRHGNGGGGGRDKTNFSECFSSPTFSPCSSNDHQIQMKHAFS